MCDEVSSSSSYVPSSSWSSWSAWWKAFADRFQAVMCLNPFIQGMAAYGCGQCMPCRVNRRRMWTHRIILEALCHGDNSFVTLTYEDEQLVYSGGYKVGLPTVRAKDLQGFLKRFRRSVEPIRVRYFAVGEYGDQSFRPHYHLALFGWPYCRNGLLQRSHNVLECGVCAPVFKAWGHGFVQVAELSVASAQYIAGYTTKKMTRSDDARLEGRQPEFARMSCVPGIGRDALWDIGSVLLDDDVAERVEDVPYSLRHGKKLLPLGRYLTHKLRETCGKDPKAPQKVLDEAKEKLQPLYEGAKVVADQAPAHVRREILRAEFADRIVASMEGRQAQMRSRELMFRKRGRL